MTLNTEPNVLFLHGWGMHSGIWGEVPGRALDLPGHGGRVALPAGAGLDDWVEALARESAEPVTLCGWSLGGQLALRWAELYPAQVERLILVASTPCFVARGGWDCAMAAPVLAQFAEALQQNYQQTLRRFLSLQLRGSEQERELLVQLRAMLFSRGEPDLLALEQGLAILRESDLRASLPQIQQPTLVIAGERDTLTPAAASEWMAAQLPRASFVQIAGAAHAPFLSHPTAFWASVTAWLNA